MLIGLGEGAISALAFYAVARARPELVGSAEASATGAGGGRGLVKYGLLASLGVALFAAPFACPWPDGLEAVAAKLGFEHAARTVASAPMSDYVFPWIANAELATALAGAVGAIVVFGLAVLLSRLVVTGREGTPPVGR